MKSNILAWASYSKVITFQLKINRLTANVFPSEYKEYYVLPYKPEWDERSD